MSLDPNLEAFLELAELGRLSGKSRPMHELSVEQARQEFSTTSHVLDPDPPGSVVVTPLDIPTRDGAELEARLYRAEHRQGEALPTILYFHGGGYVVGDLDSHDPVCRRLAASGRFAVLAPAYRRAPEAPFPTAVDDASDCANWLVGHARELGLAQRFAVAGDSVGATLATVLAAEAVIAPERQHLKPFAQLLFYPVTDISRQRESHRRYAEGYLLESLTLEWFYQHYCSAGQRLDWRASPLLGPATAPLAPTYLSLAEYDPLVDEGHAYADHLRQGGTEVTLSLERGFTHDFLRMSGITDEVASIYRNAEQWLLTR
ncbi:alpha/beta hydrolase [Pseudomonas tohonis]|uniref:alpha/beta hydrolase n=1 Tax=Pseudomonas tohonis TaxID=2725477 RepID=UPI0021DA3A94|nr:alpha/beta hydrolase [Pseudomonas tohonis]UXY50550.1 alpha/beta hydrolase fold domain-containing protein [Pseudomonas tohonis]